MAQFGRALHINQIAIPDIEKYNYEMVVKKRLSVSYQRHMIGAVKLFYQRMRERNM